MRGVELIVADDYKGLKADAAKVMVASVQRCRVHLMRTNVVGIFPNEATITRLVGALMLEQNDACAVTRRYMTQETVAAVCDGIE